jgi:hypothetical protein
LRGRWHGDYAVTDEVLGRFWFMMKNVIRDAVTYFFKMVGYVIVRVPNDLDAYGI